MPTEFEDFYLQIDESSDQPLADGDTGPAPAEAILSGEKRHLISATSGPKEIRWRRTYPVRARSAQGEAQGVFRFSGPAAPGSRSSQGEAKGVSRLPLWADEARRLVTQGPHLDDRELEDLGVGLFRTAFDDEVALLFDRTERAARRANSGVRMRLVLTASELTELPWEILRPPDWAYAPVPSGWMLMVRQLNLLHEYPNLNVEGRLVLLLVTAQPTDQHPLALDHEREHILQALEPLQREGKVRVTDLGRARKPAVLDALKTGRHHVLHFMMHADYDPRHERGVLALEGEDGRTALLEAEEFVGTLDENSQRLTRLVILNACHSGTDSSTRPGRGLAAAAARLGLPAVVAMQYPISDPAAITFAQAFYAGLVQGQRIDLAMARGRHAIRFNTEDRFRMEWIVPVLYLRSTGEHLFSGISAAPLTGTPDAEPARELIQQVDRAPASVKGVADAPGVVVRLQRPTPPEEGRRFVVTLETPEGPAQGTLELTARDADPMVPPDEQEQEMDWRVPSTPGHLRTMGEELFRQLLAGDLATRLRAARSHSQGAGVRLTLVADDPAIDLVPWEFLRDPHTSRYLTLEGAPSPFLRRIDPPGGGPARLARIEGPLRILFVTCNPRNLPLLDLEREWGWLQEAVRDASPQHVEVTRLEDPTRHRLYQSLSVGGYHALHFSGYDSFCISQGAHEEGLVLLDKDGHLDHVPCDELTNLLSGINSLRLVVTNTCNTASRLAPVLVRGGVPAVIGMRFAIRDRFAARFTLLFYRALLRFDLSVAAALAEARKLLYVELDREPKLSGNWTYPTLVTSVEGAEVFGHPV
jgi:CHAT domain-containing protein